MAKITAPTWTEPHAKIGRGKTAVLTALDMDQKKRVSKTINGLKKALDTNQDILVNVSIKTQDGYEIVSGTLRAKTQVSKAGQAMIVISDRDPLIKQTDTDTAKISGYGMFYMGTNLYVSEPTVDTTKPTEKSNKKDFSF